jgi:hypothetical protein
MEKEATDNKWHYNLGYEEGIEAVLAAIERMRDSGDYHNPTLDELEGRIE